MIKRSEKKLFYGVPGKDGGEITLTRAKFFTDLSVSKNPVEYSRHYVDEESERTDVVGYSPSISYNFDDYLGDAILEDIVEITNSEMVGLDTHRTLVQVDFSRDVDGGYYAVKRDYAVIPDSEGSGTDAYTYGGTFRAVGDKIVGYATVKTPIDGTSQNVETITFTQGEVSFG